MRRFSTFHMLADVLAMTIAGILAEAFIVLGCFAAPVLSRSKEVRELLETTSIPP